MMTLRKILAVAAVACYNRYGSTPALCLVGSLRLKATKAVQASGYLIHPHGIMDGISGTLLVQSTDIRSANFEYCEGDKVFFQRRVPESSAWSDSATTSSRTNGRNVDAGRFGSIVKIDHNRRTSTYHIEWSNGRVMEATAKHGGKHFHTHEGNIDMFVPRVVVTTKSSDHSGLLKRGLAVDGTRVTFQLSNYVIAKEWVKFINTHLTTTGRVDKCLLRCFVPSVPAHYDGASKARSQKKKININ